MVSLEEATILDLSRVANGDYMCIEGHHIPDEERIGRAIASALLRERI